MKTTHLAISVLGLGFFLATINGCQTGSPGISNELGTYSQMMNGSPDKVTQAAKASVKDMKLMDVTSNGTKIDGKVTARNAQNDVVTINIDQAGDNVSKVTVRVGTTGDEVVSKQILDRIKKNL
jgi:hypothetical protein